MNKILKHSFEAVSLLSTDNGVLEVTIIPAFDQPDWIVPSSLILSVEEFYDRVLTYLWQQQEVSVFHLGSQDMVIDKMIILEGNSEVHRVALQTSGELQKIKIRISDMQDIELTDNDSGAFVNSLANSTTGSQPTQKSKNSSSDTNQQRVQENIISSYLFQAVMIDNTEYVIPDLDKIVHHLVDLDG